VHLGHGAGHPRGAVAGVDVLSTTLTIDPALRQSFEVIRGIGWSSFGDHKVQPRDDADFDEETIPSEAMEKIWFPANRAKNTG